MTAPQPNPTAELARWLRTIYIANRPLFGDTGGNPAGWELIASEVVAQGWRPPADDDAMSDPESDDVCGQTVTIDGATFVCNLRPGHGGVGHQAQGDVPVRFTLCWWVHT